MELFSDRLRTARQYRKLSQSSLARLCGLAQSAISNYENGTRKAPREILVLARALHVSPEWLQEGVGEMHLQVQGIPQLSQTVKETPSTGSDEHWPFDSISPHELNALEPIQLQEIERALRLMLNGLTAGKQAT